METPVSAIMCSEPVTATREDSLPRIAALMRTNSVDQVPVLQGPYVVDLYTRKSLEFAKRKPNPVFLAPDPRCWFASALQFWAASHRGWR